VFVIQFEIIIDKKNSRNISHIQVINNLNFVENELFVFFASFYEWKYTSCERQSFERNSQQMRPLEYFCTTKNFSRNTIAPVDEFTKRKMREKNQVDKKLKSTNFILKKFQKKKKNKKVQVKEL
jgi:uncharacterized protein YktB (UPF0637 family)